MNPEEIVALDALDLLVVVDNESDTLSSVDKGVPQLPELGRLVVRVPHLAPKDGHDSVEPWGHLCLACPGFSALVAWRGGRRCAAAPARVNEGWCPPAGARGHRRRAPGVGGCHPAAPPRRRAPAA